MLATTTVTTAVTTATMTSAPLISSPQASSGTFRFLNKSRCCLVFIRFPTSRFRNRRILPSQDLFIFFFSSSFYFAISLFPFSPSSFISFSFLYILTLLIPLYPYVINSFKKFEIILTDHLRSTRIESYSKNTN